MSLTGVSAAVRMAPPSEEAVMYEIQQMTGHYAVVRKSDGYVEHLRIDFMVALRCCRRLNIMARAR